jgi:hypothetical protein
MADFRYFTTREFVGWLLGLVLGGSGWLKWWFDKQEARRAEERAEQRAMRAEEREKARADRDKERQEAGRALEEFLVPLEMRLAVNRRMHEVLTSNTELDRLEFAPDYVQDQLRHHPDEGQRATWKATIDSILQTNDEIIKLIYDKGFHVVNNRDLTAKLDGFVEHAKRWKDLWHTVFNFDKPAPRGRGLLAPEFPASLDATLQEEIERRRGAQRT